MTNHLSRPSWHHYAEAEEVYETLAAHQVDDVRMNDGDLITVACVQVQFDEAGAEIRFASPSSEHMASLRVSAREPSSTAVDLIEGLVTAYASHWALLLKEGPWCCGTTMERDGEAIVHPQPGVPAVIERSFVCRACGAIDVCEVNDDELFRRPVGEVQR